MLGIRVADGSLLRLIGKCLHVGVLDGELVLEPELGTAPGADAIGIGRSRISTPRSIDACEATSITLA